MAVKLHPLIAFRLIHPWDPADRHNVIRLDGDLSVIFVIHYITPNQNRGTGL